MTNPAIPLRRTGRLSPYAARLAADARAGNTRAAYAADWRAWERWLHARGVEPEAASGVDLGECLASGEAAGQALATLRRRRAGILHGYRVRGWAIDTDAADAILAGAGRRAAVPRRAKPVTADVLRVAIDALPKSGKRKTTRDKAMLLVAWQGALRASEVRSLTWADYRPSGAGAILSLRGTKGARGTGRVVEHPIIRAADPRYCPILALQAWHSACRGNGRGYHADSPMFRAFRRGDIATAAPVHKETLTEVLRAALRAAGVPVDGFSSHSLRSGFLTAAAMRGTQTWRLLEHSRHKRSETLDAYIREVRLLADHPARGLL